MQTCLLRSALCALLLLGLACGLKAPPMPRDEVVPAPIREVSVRQAADGVYLEFVMPAASLGGSPLKRIGGYRVVCHGPYGPPVKEDVRYGLTQQLTMPGRKVSFKLEGMDRPGVYRCRIDPMDAYGTRPGRPAKVDFTWDGHKIVGPGPGEPAPDNVSDSEGAQEKSEGKEGK